jgi:hypothetical protein
MHRMAWEFPKRSPLLFAILTFAVGLVAGALAVSALASAASGPHLRAAQVKFRQAQEDAAAEAWRAGRFEAAAGHAFCELDGEHGVAATRAFSDEAVDWNLVELAALRWILHSNRQAFDDVRPMAEAEDRVRYALTLEKLGRRDAAERERAAAARLSGQDADKVRQLEREIDRAWSAKDAATAAEPVPAGSAATSPAPGR